MIYPILSNRKQRALKLLIHRTILALLTLLEQIGASPSFLLTIKYRLQMLAINLNKKIINVNDTIIYVNITDLRNYLKFPRGVDRKKIIPNELKKNFVVSGDWDKEKGYVDHDYESYDRNYYTIYQIFRDNIPVEKSTQYIQYKKRIETEGRCIRRDGTVFTSIDELNKYFEKLSNIYSEIRDNGYKRQSEMGGPVSDEIRVIIDREGNLLKKAGGNHRFALARLIGVNKIPVKVQSVHYLWAIKCCEKYGSDMTQAIKLGVKDLDRYNKIHDDIRLEG